MALTPNIYANKAVVLAGVRAATDLHAGKGAVLSILNFPTEEIQANTATVLPVVRAENEMHANKAVVLAVVKGRAAHTNMLVWTATLDDHEFLFIQLQIETLVYDFFAKQWSVWGRGEGAKMVAQRGQNWNADLGAIMGALGGPNMSNIVCGDDTTGALYFMDPTLSEDYSSSGEPGTKFKRVVTGQLITRGRDNIKLNRVEVMSSSGHPTNAGNMNVTLEYSDDKGQSYRNAGDKLIVAGNYKASVEWRSLGTYKNPGRLLRLSDYGALTRVDDWTHE